MTAGNLILGPPSETGHRRVLRNFRRKPMGIAAAVVIVLMLLLAILAPVLAPYDPNLVDMSITKAPPSAEHILGGDSSGRDVLSRLIWGVQQTLYGGMLAAAVSIVLGTPAGVLAGYYPGKIDSIFTWISDALQSAPGMIILLIVAAGTRSDFTILMVTVGVLLAPGFFRLARSTTQTIRGELYVNAARVAGLSDTRIIFRHIFRHVVPAVLIQGALTIGLALGMQAGLQFLGIGSARIPTWGAMLNDGFKNMLQQPLLLLWPSIALGLAIAAFAILGSSLADSLSTSAPIFSRRQRRAIAVRDMSQKQPADVRVSTGSVSVAAVDSAVRLDNLRVKYESGGGEVEVVHGITLDVSPGEVLGIVGESGSGKSQTVFSMLDLIPKSGYYTADAIWIGGEDVTTLSKRERAQLLGYELGYVPQEPMTNLDPSYTVGYQLIEPLRAVHGMSGSQARRRALEVLERVGIVAPDRVMKSYPHELSGGMAQRVLIAGAISGKPSVLVADEPTTALDVTVQAEVLELLRELQEEYQMALVIVTHNFGVVADICDRVAVMRNGSIVEIDSVDRVFAHPESEYTRALIAASLDGALSRRELDLEYALSRDGIRSENALGLAENSEIRAKKGSK